MTPSGKSNFHTHTTWCDGKDSPAAVVQAAVERGFSDIGFSSHASCPERSPTVMEPGSGLAYVADIRRLQERFADRIRVWLGVEADYIPGVTTPEKSRYADLGLDYLIGSIHYVVSEDGGRMPVDHSPRELQEGIAAHFHGRVEEFVRAYFRQQREMVSRFDFDVVGHLDLVRKFNAKHPYFDESAAWYREELERTADAVAASGKIVEVNTGAISRGWLDDAYPSRPFRDLLRVRGVRFILSSDAHAAETIDCAFDRFAAAERFLSGSEWLNVR